MKSFVINVLRSAKGDDYERAKMAFKSYTKEEMNQEWGYSGKSCNELLNTYKEWVDKFDDAIAWVNNIKEGN